jgi:8-oxo-dGTP pyrophosphatase MutT (NUDIX family)
MEARRCEAFRVGTAGAARMAGRRWTFPGLSPRQAAVLVPLVDRPEGVSVLLTRRTEQLRHHAGQISFPGGGMDAADADAWATALREAEEESRPGRASASR